MKIEIIQNGNEELNNSDLGFGQKSKSSSKLFDEIKMDNGVIIEGQDACDYINDYNTHNGETLVMHFDSKWNCGTVPHVGTNCAITTPLDVLELTLHAV